MLQRASRWIRPIRFPLLIGFWSAAVTLPFGVIAATAIDNRLPPAGNWLNVWMRWDVMHYLALAQHGYGQHISGEQRNLLAFFPLYPEMIRLLNTLVHQPHLAALLVSNLACIGGFVFTYLLIQKERGTRIARRAVWYLAIFPTAFFLHVGYTESLFLFLAVAAFYYARCGRWDLCAVFSMFATDTRVFGVAMLPALAFEYLHQRNFRWREVRWDLAWMALAPLGLLFYLYVNYRATGNPLQFMQVQRDHWDHYFQPPWIAVADNWDGLINGTASDRVSSHGAQLVAFATGTLTVIFSAVRLRPLYTIYVAAVWVIMFCDNFPQSSPRFMLSIFPLFMLLGGWATRSWRQHLLTFSFLLFYGLFAAQFARGWWAG